MKRARLLASYPSIALVALAAIACATACGDSAPAASPANAPHQSPLAALASVAPPASANAAPRPAAPAMAPLDVDPVAVGMTADGVVKLCDESLARARAFLDEVAALDGKPDTELTWDATLGKMDKARLAIQNAGDFPALMAVSHPDQAVRDKAKLCEPKVDAFDTNLWLDARLARVVKRYSGKKETLPGPRGRLLEHTLRDFRRNGLELDEASQKRLRELNEQITKLGQEFDTNLAESHAGVDVTPAQLDGLPKEWLASHAAGKDGKVHVSTDYPDYFPVIQYAKDRKVALDLYKQFDNRAADKNVALIEKLLVLRQEKAKLLGYPTWADYALEPRMAKNAKTVAGFLEGLRTHLAKKGAAELAEFKAMHVKLGGKADDPLPPSDRLYLEDRVRQAKYGLDSKEVSKYFEVTRVKEGLLAITSKMYGIKYRKADVPTWHPDVEPMEITDESGKLLGRFYFDLYPRDGKYKHAAVFSIRDTMKMEDGARLVPIAAIECNFPKPGGAAPALMSHEDATTFFHEFGHVLHHLLSQADLASFSGTNVARDFVESPSQMFEEWTWSRETLDLFAHHHDTNKPIPKDLYASMLRARSFGRALQTQRQLFLAALDQAYHTRPAPMDTTKVLQEINDAYTPFKYVEGTHFQGTFGHLIGYDAGYYGYQWALSIAQDLLTRFKKAGLLDPKTAADYRNVILASGASDDENALVAKFLGRVPSDAAYKAFLLE